MAVCERCASPLEDGVLLCPYCSAPQRNPSWQTGGTGRGLRCPACGQMDRVRKVSALYEAEQAAASGPSDTPSAIFSQLAPPPEPHAPVPAPPGRRVLIVSSVIALVAGGILAFVVTQMGLNTADHSLLAFAICASGALAAFLGCSAFFDSRARRELKVKQGTYSAAYVEYAQVFDRWQSLYYCSRDGIVYLPDTDLCAPAVDALDFCYGRVTNAQPS